MPQSPTLAKLLQDARQLLAAALGLPDPEARIEAQMLLGHACGNMSRAWLIGHETDIPSPSQAETFAALLQRRLAGEPVAYLLGTREFYGLEFTVTPAVLIPRPDTETLVEAALARLPEHQPCRVLDLGTGSGAIAIAIAKHRPQAEVIATDRSPEALQVAAANARKLGTPNVRCVPSHWFDALDDAPYDLIASNPPYIAAGDPHLAQGDLRFEPPSALSSGQDGLDDIREIVSQAPQHLKAGGWLLLEHGYDQAEAVAGLLREAGFGEVGSVEDLGGMMRVTMGRLP
jgi:release factor glutamine methyltransferase